MAALLFIALILLLIALVVQQIAASPLFSCLGKCFDSWADASRRETVGKRD